MSFSLAYCWSLAATSVDLMVSRSAETTTGCMVSVTYGVLRMKSATRRRCCSMLGVRTMLPAGKVTCSSTSSPRPSASSAEGRGEDVDEHVLDRRPDRVGEIELGILEGARDGH